MFELFGSNEIRARMGDTDIIASGQLSHLLSKGVQPINRSRRIRTPDIGIEPDIQTRAEANFNGKVIKRMSLRIGFPPALRVTTCVKVCIAGQR